MGFHHSYISLSKADNGYIVSQTIGLANDGEVKEDVIESKNVETNTIYFRVNVEYEMKCTFSYSFDGENFEEFGRSFKGSEGHWVGAKIGIFNLNFTKAQSKGYSDFDWIRFCR